MRVEDGQVAAANAILSDHAAVDLVARRNAYREGGWAGFDASVPAYPAGDEAARERACRETVL